MLGSRVRAPEGPLYKAASFTTCRFFYHLQAITLCDYQIFHKLCDLHNEDYKKLVGKETTYKTYSRYILTRNHLADFFASKYKSRDIILADISPKFVSDFYTFVRNNGDHSNNYSMKFVQRFRTIYNVALNNGWVSTDPFATFKFDFDKTERGCLTLENVEMMLAKRCPQRG